MSFKAVRVLSITLAFLVAFIPSSSQGQSSSDNSNSGIVSDHDRLLLEKIDRLERRIAELEARTGMEAPAKKPDPAVTRSNITQAGIQPAAETQVANSSTTPPEAEEPFAFADFTWLNGNSRTKESPLDSKVFTGEFRADIELYLRPQSSSGPHA